jgi:hypothetical protein
MNPGGARVQISGFWFRALRLVGRVQGQGRAWAGGGEGHRGSGERPRRGGDRSWYSRIRLSQRFFEVLIPAYRSRAQTLRNLFHERGGLGQYVFEAFYLGRHPQRGLGGRAANETPVLPESDAAHTLWNVPDFFSRN